jgi:hypothetical protein
MADDKSLGNVLHQLFSSRIAMQDLLAQSKVASTIVDGFGVNRVVDKLLGV